MTSSRNKAGVAFWATVVVLVLVLYPLSFGPACWISGRLGCGASLLPKIYGPLIDSMRIGEEKERWQCAAYSWAEGRPEKVPVVPDGRMAWYAGLGAPAGWHWQYCAIYTFRNNPNGDGRIRLRDEAWEWSSVR